MISRKVLAVFLMIYSFAKIDECFGGSSLRPSPGPIPPNGTPNPFSELEFSSITSYLISSPVPGVNPDTASCVQKTFLKLSPYIVNSFNAIILVFGQTIQGILNAALQNNVYGIQIALENYQSKTSYTISQFIKDVQPIANSNPSQCSPSVSPTLQKQIIYYLLGLATEFIEDVSLVVIDTFTALLDFFYDCNTFPQFAYGGASIIITGGDQVIAYIKSGFDTDVYAYVSLSLLKNVNNSVCTVIGYRAVDVAINSLRLLITTLGGFLTYYSQTLVGIYCLFGGNTYLYG